MYPDDTMILGRDLGPAIDIGPGMTRKILKANGKIVYRLTVRSLTLDEIADKTMMNELRGLLKQPGFGNSFFRAI